VTGARVTQETDRSGRAT